MSIAVVAPIFDEIRFIEAWLQNVSFFADEIIVVDTGSTDGTFERLVEAYHNNLKGRLKLHRRCITEWRFDWDESEVRNFLLGKAKADWIVPLDADELVGDDFIQLVHRLEKEHFVVGRFVEFKFWSDMQHLRKRTLWPRWKEGKLHLLSNWRGAYPNLVPRLLRNNRGLYYQGRINPLIRTPKLHPRLLYRLPWLTKDFDIGFYHYHYAFPPKPGEFRTIDRSLKVKLVEFRGVHPIEATLYEST